MRTMIMLVVLVGFPSLGWGLETGHPEPSTLTVSANGTVTASPDVALISFGVETSGKLLVEAQRKNSTAMQRVMDRLRGLKIDKERIQTTSFTVTPQYRQVNRRESDPPIMAPEIIGYSVSNQLSVEVHDLDNVAAVIDESLAAGANHFHGVHWMLRDEQPRRLGALQVAAGKAREKATALSQTLKVKLVRVLNVNEGGHVVRPAPYMGRAMAAMESAAADVPISSGELKVEAMVTLIYEIAQE
jgi:uncharacterized protein